MFQASFEKLRTKILFENTIMSLMHMPYLGKGGTSMGINFGTAAFIIEKSLKPDFIGSYCCVRYYESDNLGVPYEFPPENERLAHATGRNFRALPGFPIAYWISPKLFKAFEHFEPLNSVGQAKQGIATADNDRFLRQWFEVADKKSIFNATSASDVKKVGARWIPHRKGGEFRRWAGNNDYLLDWKSDGAEIVNNPKARAQNIEHWFKSGASWSHTTTGTFSARFANTLDSSFKCNV